jgi:uncharacterized protein YecE (DUF72 family)
MRIRIGCSGWFYWHWRELFYPAKIGTKDWFRHYTQSFDTVELNAPFYRWPNPATVKAWRRAAPEGSRYSVKVNQLITHEKRLVRTRKLIRDFISSPKSLVRSSAVFFSSFRPATDTRHRA